MSGSPRTQRTAIVQRAGNRCEYCRLSQTGQEATFHIDHVVPRSANGPDTTDNLALACVSCSLRKGAGETGIDPETGDEIPLFNPRNQQRDEHFYWDGTNVEAHTATGRATIAALSLNRALILEIRNEEAIRGRHPPTCPP